MRIRVLVDISMLVIVLLLMCYHSMENIWHEVLGVSLFVVFILHNYLNWFWYRSLLKFRFSVEFLSRVIVNLLLAIIMLVMIVNSVFISHSVFDFIPAESSLFVNKIHLFCAYWLLIIMSVHIGLHGKWIQGLLKKIHLSGMLVKALLHLIAVSSMIDGALLFMEKGIASKLIMLDAFGNWSADSAIWSNFRNYFIIVLGISCFTSYLMRTLKALPYHKIFGGKL